MTRLAAVLALGPTILGLALAPVSAQEADAHGSHAVSSHAHGTVVALALRIPAGSQDDAPGLEGTAWLLARVLEDQVARALESTAAVFTASVERASTVFTLVADPTEWEEAWNATDSLLLHAPLDPGLVERHRSRLLENLAFEADSPYREFEDVAAALLTEPGSPWARPPRGTSTSLAALGTADLERYRARYHRRDAGAWAVVGPVVPDPPAVVTPSAPPAPPAPADMAWVTGDRVDLARDVTSTWMMVAYPAPSDLPRTCLELVAHLLEEDLDPTPPAPDRYSVDVRIEETRRGPVLLVEASVVPEAAADWEARILGLVENMATEPLADDFFPWRRRRFRAERLLAESPPEAEARRITADLLRDGRVRDLGVEIWELDARTLLETSRSLGPPRILVLGPDLGQDGSGASW